MVLKGPGVKFSAAKKLGTSKTVRHMGEKKIGVGSTEAARKKTNESTPKCGKSWGGWEKEHTPFRVRPLRLVQSGEG